jgi:flagellar protein FlgJ
MDITGTGTVYYDNSRLGVPPGAGANPQGIASRGAEDFASVLTRGTAPHTGDSGAAGGRTAVIDKQDKLYEQCLELEIFLVKNLVSSMRNTVQKSGLIDEGFAGKMYEDMLYDEYARDFTMNANFGLAEQAYLELSGQRGKVLFR